MLPRLGRNRILVCFSEESSKPVASDDVENPFDLYNRRFMLGQEVEERAAFVSLRKASERLYHSIPFSVLLRPDFGKRMPTLVSIAHALSLAFPMPWLCRHRFRQTSA